MSQPANLFNLCAENNKTLLTALGGIGILFELWHLLKLPDVLDGELPRKGWPSSVIVMTIMLINIAGGSSVDDVKMLMADGGLCKAFKTLVLFRVSGKKPQYLKKMMEEAGTPFPSTSAIQRFLNAMHDDVHDSLYEEGKAVIIPETNKLQALWKAMDRVTTWLAEREQLTSVTLDMDATLIPSEKQEAKFTYKKFKGYQPLNFFLAEMNWMLYSQFRDGNVPAGYSLLAPLKTALARLPHGVKDVTLRSDSAGHVNELLSYCEEGKDEELGRIYFAIAAKLSQSLRKAIVDTDHSQWHPIFHDYGDGSPVKTEQEYAEIVYVSNELGRTKKMTLYRFIAIRTPLPPVQAQLPLDGTDVEENEDAAISTINHKRYKLTALVTNFRHPIEDKLGKQKQEESGETFRHMDGEAVIHFLRKRCGDSEQIHSTLKTDLAGGRMPSGRFGANATWWAIAIMTANCMTLLKPFAFNRTTIKMKRFRFLYLNIPARILTSARRTEVRLPFAHPALAALQEAQKALYKWATPPAILAA